MLVTEKGWGRSGTWRGVDVIDLDYMVIMLPSATGVRRE